MLVFKVQVIFFAPSGHLIKEYNLYPKISKNILKFHNFCQSECPLTEAKKVLSFKFLSQY